MPRAKLPQLDAETERRLAAGLYNETWRLMELPNRSPEQDAELLHAAHASRYHWGRIGQPVNLARGEWLCARVYAVLGRGEPAVWHATRCHRILEETGSGEDWDLAAACEANARAYGVAGDTKRKAEWLAKARAALELIADPEDRAQIEREVDSIG